MFMGFFDRPTKEQDRSISYQTTSAFSRGPSGTLPTLCRGKQKIGALGRRGGAGLLGSITTKPHEPIAFSDHRSHSIAPASSLSGTAMDYSHSRMSGQGRRRTNSLSRGLAGVRSAGGSVSRDSGRARSKARAGAPEGQRPRLCGKGLRASYKSVFTGRRRKDLQ